MNRAELKAKAKQQIKVPFWTLVVILLLQLLLCCIPYASIVIAPALNLSLCIIFLNVVRDRKVEISDLFSGFNKLGRAWWLYFLTGLFTALWSLLLIIPGIVKAHSYAMTPFIMADHPEMSAQDAIRASSELMDGHKGELFWLRLTFIGWDLLAALTLNIGHLALNPYKNAAEAAFYRQLVSENRYAE